MTQGLQAERRLERRDDQGGEHQGRRQRKPDRSTFLPGQGDVDRQDVDHSNQPDTDREDERERDTIRPVGGRREQGGEAASKKPPTTKGRLARASSRARPSIATGNVAAAMASSVRHGARIFGRVKRWLSRSRSSEQLIARRRRDQQPAHARRVGDRAGDVVGGPGARLTGWTSTVHRRRAAEEKQNECGMRLGTLGLVADIIFRRTAGAIEVNERSSDNQTDRRSASGYGRPQTAWRDVAVTVDMGQIVYA